MKSVLDVGLNHDHKTILEKLKISVSNYGCVEDDYHYFIMLERHYRSFEISSSFYCCCMSNRFYFIICAPREMVEMLLWELGRPLDHCWNGATTNLLMGNLSNRCLKILIPQLPGYNYKTFLWIYGMMKC